VRGHPVGTGARLLLLRPSAEDVETAVKTGRFVGARRRGCPRPTIREGGSDDTGHRREHTPGAGAGAGTDAVDSAGAGGGVGEAACGGGGDGLCGGAGRGFAGVAGGSSTTTGGCPGSSPHSSSIGLTLWAAPLLSSDELTSAGAEAYLAFDDAGWVLLGLGGISIGMMIIGVSLAALDHGRIPKCAGWVKSGARRCLARHVRRRRLLRLGDLADRRRLLPALRARSSCPAHRNTARRLVDDVDGRGHPVGDYETRRWQRVLVMGGTGLEPVTPSLSRRLRLPREGTSMLRTSVFCSSTSGGKGGAGVSRPLCDLAMGG